MCALILLAESNQVTRAWTLQRIQSYGVIPVVTDGMVLQRYLFLSNALSLPAHAGTVSDLAECMHSAACDIQICCIA